MPFAWHWRGGNVFANLTGLPAYIYIYVYVNVVSFLLPFAWNLRGGNVELRNNFNVNLEYLNNSNNDVLNGFKKTLEMEQNVYQGLLQLHKVAEEENDPQFADFIESEYLQEQVEALNEVAKYVSQLERIGEDGHGVWNFDREFKS